MKMFSIKECFFFIFCVKQGDGWNFLVLYDINTVYNGIYINYYICRFSLSFCHLHSNAFKPIIFSMCYVLLSGNVYAEIYTKKQKIVKQVWRI